jgi:hypothetical protein
VQGSYDGCECGLQDRRKVRHFDTKPLRYEQGTPDSCRGPCMNTSTAEWTVLSWNIWSLSHVEAKLAAVAAWLVLHLLVWYWGCACPCTSPCRMSQRTRMAAAAAARWQHPRPWTRTCAAYRINQDIRSPCTCSLGLAAGQIVIITCAKCIASSSAPCR